MERVQRSQYFIDFGFRNSPHREYVINKSLSEEWFVKACIQSCFSRCTIKMTEKATSILVPMLCRVSVDSAYKFIKFMKFIKCVVSLTPVFARSVVKANPPTRNVFFGATTTRDDRSRRE